jgi:anti-anti-sigma factor
MFDHDDTFSPHFRLRHRDGIAIAELHGPEIRHPGPAIEMGTDLRRLVADQKPKGLLVDLARVLYLCSSGFGALLETSRKAQAAGTRMTICGIHPDVAVGANILGLGRLIDTYGDESDALASYS